MRGSEDALTTVMDEIFILGLVLLLGGIVAALVFGMLPFIPKTAYLATEFSVREMPGYAAIQIFHQGGDSLNFTPTTDQSFPGAIYIETPTGWYSTEPDTDLPVFSPGNFLYLYYTGSRFQISPDLTGVTGSRLPSPDMRVVILDPDTGILLREWRNGTYAIAPSGSTPVMTTAVPTQTVTITPTATTTANLTPQVTVNSTTPTPAPTTNVTATATAAATATVPPTPTANQTTPLPTATPVPATTVVTATPTPTSTPASLVISVSWSPPGLGKITPPGTTPGTVTVIRGASQTFTFTPNANKRVIAITLDGSQVSAGGTNGQTVTYSLNNVQAAHTLTATFG